MGVRVVVEKLREIYFLDNIKVHLDEVGGLGTFIEIEAQGVEGSIAEEELLHQCKSLMRDFDIHESDLVSHSYADMLARE